MSTIREKREALELIIENAYNALKALRDQCNHSGELSYQYQSSSDGWSKSDDAYWMDWHCHECGNRWTTSQDDAFELTTKWFPNAKQVR